MADLKKTLNPKPYDLAEMFFLAAASMPVLGAHRRAPNIIRQAVGPCKAAVNLKPCSKPPGPATPVNPATQRPQNPSIQEYTLNHIRVPNMI